MPKGSDIRPDKHVSMLLKGPFGIGKTLAALSFAHFGNVYLAYFDKAIPIEMVMFFQKMGREDLLSKITWKPYNAVNVYEYLNDLIEMVKEPGRYIAGVTDSVTMFTASAVNWSMQYRTVGMSEKELKERRQKEKDLIPGFDEYKVETSLVTQCLDLTKVIPWYNIWIAHPLPQTKIEGSGRSMTVTKTTSIVSYGSKVAGIVPGAFNEIYHFGRNGPNRLVYTDMQGDDFAKTSFNLPMYFDITNKLFAEVWMDLISKALSTITEDKSNGVTKEFDPSSIQVAQTTPSNKKPWE